MTQNQPLISIALEDPKRALFRCFAFGHQWVRVGVFEQRDIDQPARHWPVRHCARCRVGHPQNPEITSFRGTS